MSVRNRVRKSFSKSLKGKACKFRFTVTYEYVDLKCNNRWQPSCLSIVWFRSHRSKVSEKPTSKVSITDEKTGIVSYAANWFPPNSVDLVVTLYKDFTGVMFRKKDYMFVLENVTADARKKLAIFPCNMAEYASLDMEVFDLEMEFKPLSKKIVSARIGAKVRCEFIKEGRADEDDMQSNFSHLSEAEFKSRLSELAECSDEEEEEEEEEEENSKPRESNKLADRSKHTWSQFIDEMKTLEYRNVAMLGNPLADATVSGNNQVYVDDTSKEITHASQETASEEADTKRSKLLERDRDRRKVVSAAFEDLKESTIPEEDGEEDLEDMSINLSSTAMSSLSSFKNKFQFSFSGKNKRRSSDSSSAELPGNIETVPSETREKRVSDWLQENPHEDGDSQLRVEQLEKDNMNLRAAYQKLVTKVTDLEKEKTDMQSELEQLGIMAEFGKSDFARERDELQAEITELQMLVEDLRMQLGEAESKLTDTSEKEVTTASYEGGKKNAPKTKLCEVRGWLCKRGVKGLTGRKWRRRWFSTDKDSRLYYYQKNNNTSPRGFIDLDVIIAVQDQPPSQQDINNACFNVVTPTRTYELMAHDEQEKLRWINALDYLRHWRNRLASSNENK
ncbi:transcriptional regulator ATRX homolog isoform X1 [Pocillopora verrucosa]|uniref:transcriptional regulator ATRX homolog isoform X1 n=1 Tax=Pocillopora verrucosa TaxID=203993 RepID=UPI0027976FCA|nr:DNA ligase 1-like isoform X1 [Pocillopora verrucosa]